MVVVLNIFTVLTMSMIYYYGQLHIGHGLNETVRSRLPAAVYLCCALLNTKCNLVDFGAAPAGERICATKSGCEETTAIRLGCILGICAFIYGGDGANVLVPIRFAGGQRLGTRNPFCLRCRDSSFDKLRNYSASCASL